MIGHTIKHPDGLGMVGTITVREHPAGTIERCERMISAGNPMEAVRIAKSGRVAIVQRNLIMQASNYGKDLIIQRLCGVNTYSLNIAYGEIGTSQTTPLVTDTALGTPTARTQTANAIDVNSTQAQLQFFFADAVLPNQTYYEFGTFVDGSNTIGTGQIFNHALFQTPYTKAAGTDITVEVDITIS